MHLKAISYLDKHYVVMKSTPVLSRTPHIHTQTIDETQTEELEKET